jgi:hypothetical protein
VVHTHCHAGAWDVPHGDASVRAKLKVECGWGPTPLYGITVEPKRWDGMLELSEGRLLSVEPCFTIWGQRIDSVDERRCQWSLNTPQQRQAAWGGTPQQALVFEVEMPRNGRIALNINGRQDAFTLGEAMAGSRVVAFMDEARTLVQDRFLLTPEEIENPDTYWHNAYKVKIHTAIPEAGYRVQVDWEDENAPPGRNWYYLRVSELNGQMAWSSPIWVDSD